MTLAAEVTSRENAITWMPLPPTQKWLNDRLLQMVTEMTNEQNPRVLRRLKLARQLHLGTPARRRSYISMEKFSACRPTAASTSGCRAATAAAAAISTCGSGCSAGRVVPGVGFFPGRASRFFAVATGATSLGKEALQVGHRSIRAQLPGPAAGRLSSRRLAALQSERRGRPREAKRRPRLVGSSAIATIDSAGS